MDSVFPENQHLHVLIAEDNHINQVLVQRVVDKLGYKTTIVNNGREVLDILEKEHIHLILMDVQMPIMNGLEATEAVIKKYADKRPLIIAITAGSIGDDVNKCMEAGMDDFMNKPFRLEEIKAMLSKWSAKLMQTVS